MAIPSWPPTLPQTVLRDSYGESYPNNLLTSNVDAGIPKVRRKGAKPASLLRLSMLLTKDQVATLFSFIEDTIEDGALIFNFTHPRTGLSVIVRFKPKESGIVDITPLGTDHYTTAFDFTVMP